jgi:hypothetical protein
MKWMSIVMFFWLVYHSEAEYLPTRFKVAQDSKETPFPEARDEVDDDAGSRAVAAFMRTLHLRTSDVDVHLIGPGTFKGAKKILPHGSKTELFWSYRAWAKSKETAEAPASYKTFMRVAEKILGPQGRDAHLGFRKPTEHAKCDVCTRLKISIRKATMRYGAASSHARLAQESLTRHILSQWLDRQIYWSFRALSQTFFKQSMEFGHRVLISSISTSLACVICDGMDQAKFKVPRVRAAATSKLLGRLFRPTLHMTAAWIHGRSMHFWVSDENLCKDSSTQAEIFSRVLDDLFSLGRGWPLGLAVQQDNTYREGKNRYIMNYLLLMVGLGVFRWSVANFLRTGHSPLAHKRLNSLHLLAEAELL